MPPEVSLNGDGSREAAGSRSFTLLVKLSMNAAASPRKDVSKPT
jgi:hypothetical protein